MRFVAIRTTWTGGPSDRIEPAAGGAPGQHAGRRQPARIDPVDVMLDRQPDPRRQRTQTYQPSWGGDPARALDTESRDVRPAREAFLEVLSHELRTPITTIYAGSSVLARHGGLSASATRTLAANISAEAARLYDVVEDLLVIARLERRVLDPIDEPVLVQRAVDATIRMTIGRLDDARIERHGDAEVPPVHGDATYVEHACRNLIMASIRHARPEPGHQPFFDVRSNPEAGEVTVAVLDDGPSLAPDELDHAFELPSASAVGRLAGSGIGPFVCRLLVEAMGGRVWAANRPGGGLVMGFALAIDDTV